MCFNNGEGFSLWCCTVCIGDVRKCDIGEILGTDDTISMIVFPICVNIVIFDELFYNETEMTFTYACVQGGNVGKLQCWSVIDGKEDFKGFLCGIVSTL